MSSHLIEIIQTVAEGLRSAHVPEILRHNIRDSRQPMQNTDGGSNLVHKCILQQNPAADQYVAIKTLKDVYIYGLQDKYTYEEIVSKKVLKVLLRDASSFMERNRENKNTAQFLGFVDNFKLGNMPTIGLVFVWYDNGNLLDYVSKNNSTLRICDRLELLYGVASGLEFLHSNNYVHRDIKGQNIFVDKHGVPYIGDFGISKNLEEEGLYGLASTQAVSVQWTPPEWLEFGLKGNWHNPKFSGDMWSFGCVFLEVLRGKFPYAPMDDYHIENRVRPKPPPRPSDLNIDDLYWNYMQKCWNFDPKKRPSAKSARGFLKSCLAKLSKPQSPHSSRHSRISRHLSPIIDAILHPTRMFTSATDLFKKIRNN